MISPIANIKDILEEGTKWLPQLAILGGIGATTFAVGGLAFSKKDLPL
ncbi:hypothetical protein ABZ559_08960 [Streptococcus sp. ZY19097]